MDTEDEAEVQLSLSGVALGFAEPPKKEGEGKESEMVFSLEEVQGEDKDREQIAQLKLGR